jgi:hypothetical protein
MGSVFHPYIKGSINRVETCDISQEKKFKTLWAAWEVVLTAAWDAQGIYLF